MYYADALQRDRVANGGGHDAGSLLGGGDELAVHGAFVEQAVRVGLLEVGLADLDAGDVRSDGQDRSARALGVVQTVDEVEIARAAGARAHRELPGQLGLGRRGEGGSLLVAHVDPVDPALGGTAGLAHGVDDRVERVPDDAVDAVDTGIDELGDELFGDVHACASPWDA